MEEREIFSSLYAFAFLRQSLAVFVVTPRGSEGVKRFVVLAQAPGGILVIRVPEAARGTQERAETVAAHRLANSHRLFRNAEALHRLLVFARVSSEIHKRCCQANLSIAKASHVFETVQIFTAVKIENLQSTISNFQSTISVQIQESLFLNQIRLKKSFRTHPRGRILSPVIMAAAVGEATTSTGNYVTQLLFACMQKRKDDVERMLSQTEYLSVLNVHQQDGWTGVLLSSHWPANTLLQTG